MPPWALKLAYQLQIHRVGRGGLDQWLIGLALLAAAAGFLGRPAWHPNSPAISWLGEAAGLGVAALGFALRLQGRRAGYLRFTPTPDAPAPAGLRLDPSAKIRVQASGEFSVDGKRRFFADLPAYWRTFGSREHAVMAIVHPTRFLVVGTIPPDDQGMWYIFFRPESIRAVVAGELAFGRRSGPGLQVHYCSEEPILAHAARRHAGSENEPLTVYLHFSTRGDREQVWADLAAEARAVE